MKKNNNIENLFKSSFDDYRVKPDSQSWINISKKLSGNKFTTFNLRTFNIYYLSGILVTMIAIGFLIDAFNPKQKFTELATIRKIKNLEIKKSVHLIDSIQDNPTTINFNEPTIKINKKQGKEIKDVRKNNNCIETVEFLPNMDIRSIAVKETSKSKTVEHIKAPLPKPFFELNTYKGCAPLTIKVKNTTKYAHQYEWSFGNEEFSTEENPTHTFKEAGLYTITLKAIGAGGAAYYIIDSVVVHEKLINKTSLSFNNKLSENKQFMASVEPENRVYYKWYFGDGNTSSKQKAIHSYKKEGRYTISLVCKDNNNCYDSTIIKNVVVAKSPCKIIYPNAFCPNLSGASSGRYSLHNTRNEIFYPLVVGTLSEYHIKIYAKTGVVLFETEDISIGWNGYYKNKLMPEGVYPYIVTLKFEGEQKAIQKKGNITILHRNCR